VVNPTGDLDGAEAEGGRIRELFGAHPGVHIVERRGAKATRATLLRDFRSGAFDVIHYAGHAFFDPAHVSRSGLVCHRQEVLSGADLAGLGRLPGLVFFNACEAGRVRGGAAPAVTTNPVARNVGLAEAFLRGGAANYVGTYWPVGDASASRFAETFYARLMQGGSMGSAVLAGRLAVEKLRSIDWADYIHYGDPEFALKLK
jgi:CHAT domain-containing protein